MVPFTLTHSWTWSMLSWQPFGPYTHVVPLFDKHLVPFIMTTTCSLLLRQLLVPFYSWHLIITFYLESKLFSFTLNVTSSLSLWNPLVLFYSDIHMFPFILTSTCSLLLWNPLVSFYYDIHMFPFILTSTCSLSHWLPLVPFYTDNHFAILTLTATGLLLSWQTYIVCFNPARLTFQYLSHFLTLELLVI